MKPAQTTAFIETIHELCKMCYTCVRECPSKAIRIVEGQAEVIPERCVACGNCVKVCSQNAKKSVSTLDEVEELLKNRSGKLAACLAPSFPAEFPDLQHKQLVGMLRKAGFDLVWEVGFGADLVADRYAKLFSAKDGKAYLATSCPALVGFVERYHPNLIQNLVPIVSPMVATARILKEMKGPEWQMVFIGPCIAKKVEARSRTIPDEIDSVITFLELRQLFQKYGITPEGVETSEFDPPHPGIGSLFAISRGMLQAAGIEEDLMLGEVVATKGRSNFLEALREFDEGNLDARLLEALCCQGCIMGPGMTGDVPLFRRRAFVSRYVRQQMKEFNQQEWLNHMARFKDLDLSRTFVVNDQRISPPDEKDVVEIMARMGKLNPEDTLNCGACGYDSCREHAIAIYKGLAETEMCLPYTIDRLRKTINELALSHQKLASTQEALMQSEKLASMGQLAAGIAHEVNNPLGVVLMYAHLLLDECQENSRTKNDLSIIAEQADRCKKIVSGLLHFARQNKVLRQPCDLRNLIDRSLIAVPKPDNINIEVHHKLEDPVIEVDGDQMIQVLTNLTSNAFAAMPRGGTLTIETSDDADTIHVMVRDSGVGIPSENRKKIFEPFFTTKEIGKGTGLGLAVAYGIIKMHRGDIRVESNDNPAAGQTGTRFIITFLRNEGSLGAA